MICAIQYRSVTNRQTGRIAISISRIIKIYVKTENCVTDMWPWDIYHNSGHENLILLTLQSDLIQEPRLDWSLRTAMCNSVFTSSSAVGEAARRSVMLKVLKTTGIICTQEKIHCVLLMTCKQIQIQENVLTFFNIAKMFYVSAVALLHRYFTILSM